MKEITSPSEQWKTCNCSPRLISLQCVDFYPNSVVIYSCSHTKQPMVDYLPLNSLHIFVRAVILFIDICYKLWGKQQIASSVLRNNLMISSKSIICKQMTFALLIKHDK